MVRKQWFNNDELLVNVLFTSKRTIYDRSYLMKSNGKSMKQNPTAKLLDITFDCNLTWNEQTDFMTKLNYGVLRVLNRVLRVMKWMNHLFYHELIIAMFLMANCLIVWLNDYSEFRTVLQDMFLVDIFEFLHRAINAKEFSKVFR